MVVCTYYQSAFKIHVRILHIRSIFKILLTRIGICTYKDLIVQNTPATVALVLDLGLKVEITQHCTRLIYCCLQNVCAPLAQAKKNQITSSYDSYLTQDMSNKNLHSQ